MSRLAKRALLVFFCLSLSAFAAAAAPGHSKDWWNIPGPEKFDADSLKTGLQFIKVNGNHFVNEKGETVIFRGVSISDPDKLIKDGKWRRNYFAKIKNWGANVVRIPVHPIAWRQRGEKAYLKILDQAVIWAGELDLYLIIDWHSIGNLPTGLFQRPMYKTSLQETFNFWRSISFRYQGIPVTAFYEIFNEPTDKHRQLGIADWNKWKAFYEEVISVIYAYDKRVIPMVAGFDWAYNLTEAGAAPVEREGIAYVSHPYPMKAKAPFIENWEKDFGFMAKKYPLFATEIGYALASEPGAHSPVTDDGSYGPRIIKYLDSKGASWAAWVFDPDWKPQMFSDWNYTPTVQGKFFKQVMRTKNTAAGK